MTPYEVLGVSPQASRAEVTAAYRVLVQIFHPDRFHGCADAVRREAERRMQTLNDAYAVVSGDTPSRARAARSYASETRTRADGPQSWARPAGHGTPWDEAVRVRAAQARQADAARLARERAAVNGAAVARRKGARGCTSTLAGLGEALVNDRIRCKRCDSVQWLPDGWKTTLGTLEYLCSHCGSVMLSR